jgi:CHAD domain-containing protein
MMTPVAVEKWISDAEQDEQLDQVAARTLQARLEAVQLYLERATDRAEHSVENVHQVRVWTRRAAAALNLYADLLPRRRTRRLKKTLRQIRRTAGEARDCDILAERLADDPKAETERDWSEQTRTRRVKAEQSLIALHDRLERDRRFERQIKRLLVRIRPRRGLSGQSLRFAVWARLSLRPIVDRFFAAGADVRSDEALHRFRIRGKELRYAMELLLAAFPATFRDELYPIVEDLQDRLGEISDLVTVSRLTHAKESGSNKAQRAFWKGQRHSLEQAAQGFRAWWTAERGDALRARFDAMLERPVSLPMSVNGFPPSTTGPISAATNVRRSCV